MKITKEEVKHVANLARLALSEEEKEAFTTQLDKILEYADKVKELNTEFVSPTAHPLAIRNVFREDKVRPSLPVEDVLSNAPEREGNYFKVPRIVEQD